MVHIYASFCFAIRSKMADWWPFSLCTPDVEHILKHFSDRHLPILFKLGTQITNNGLHKHVIFFRDQIQDGLIEAISLLKRFHNHFSDMHGLILFKLSTSTVHEGIHVHLFIWDLIKYGRPVDCRLFSL